MSERTIVPLYGDRDISASTMPLSLPDWISDFDKIPILLALSLYRHPRKELYTFKLLEDKIRAASWTDGKTLIIGLRGTSPDSRYGELDIKDDVLISKPPDLADRSQHTRTKLSLTKLGETLVKPGYIVIFAGHSLGGTAAHQLVQLFPNSRGVGYNAGAPPTFPILYGDQNRFIHYHIVGDLMSCSMSDEAGVIRRIKIDGLDFGGYSPHSTCNLLKKNGVLITSTEEDEDYYKWGRDFKGNSVSGGVLAIFNFMEQVQVEDIVTRVPIPNSKRWNKMHK